MEIIDIIYIYNANSNTPRLLTGGRVSCTLALRQHRLTRVKAETVRVNPHEPENYESGPADGIDQAGIYIYIFMYMIVYNDSGNNVSNDAIYLYIYICT